MTTDTAPLSVVLGALEAGGETTRLRLLALLAEAEITVTELVAILGQSQPRVSRHLKLLSEAGLIDRHREGAWAFFHLAQSGAMAALARDNYRFSTLFDEVVKSEPFQMRMATGGN